MGAWSASPTALGSIRTPRRLAAAPYRCHRADLSPPGSSASARSVSTSSMAASSRYRASLSSVKSAATSDVVRSQAMGGGEMPRLEGALAMAAPTVHLGPSRTGGAPERSSTPKTPTNGR